MGRTIRTRHPSPKKGKPALEPVPDRSLVSHERYTPEILIDALTKSRGMVAVAARLLRCERQTIYNAMKRHPEIAEVLENERELMLDTAELKLVEAINRGQAWAICFYLKTQGRQRGYIEKHDVSVSAATLEDLLLLGESMEKESAS